MEKGRVFGYKKLEWHLIGAIGLDPFGCTRQAAQKLDLKYSKKYEAAARREIDLCAIEREEGFQGRLISEDFASSLRMDNTINIQHRWILEFLLRQPVHDNVITRLLSTLSLPLHDDPHLFKSLLIRRISSLVHRHFISEKILDCLDLIQELDHLNGVALLDSMKEAYRAVAMDCTLRFFKEHPKNVSEYNNALDRIWRGRILDMESGGMEVSLVSDWSKVFRPRLEEAVHTCFLVEDTKDDALKAVRVFLREVNEKMGLSFLEVVAKTVTETIDDNEDQFTIRGSLDDQAGATQGPSFDAFGENFETSHEISSGDKSSKIDVDCSAEKSDTTKKCNSVLNQEFDELGDNFERDHGNVTGDTSSRVDVACCAEKAPKTKKCNPVLTPEFRKVQEALKSSIADLNDVVKDPLPDALCMAASVAANMANEGMNDLQSAENQNAVDMDISDHSSDKDCGDIQAKEGSKRKPAVVSRPSLMQRNNTARRLEWDDDSSDSSLQESQKRPHLPTPISRVFTPLRRQKIRNITGRRKKKKWSSLEEQTLIDAVKEYGRGNWKRILDSYYEIFEERTGGDLKDKWRNLTK